MIVYLIGIGPGNPDLLTGQAKKIINDCPILVGNQRMLAAFQASGKRLVASYQKKEIVALIQSLKAEEGPIGVLVSGDVGFFSLAALLKDMPGCKIKRIPGISSLVYFAAALEESWQDAYLISRHGRQASLIQAVRQHQKVFAITGGKDTPAALCRELVTAGLGDLPVALGCNLSYANEEILRGRAKDFCNRQDDSLAVLMIWNEAAKIWQRPLPGLPDEAFLRGKVPMTKAEIRSVALAKLAPQPASVIYDIGAGTGSCSVELALQAPFGQIYAFEVKPEARDLLAKNIAHFHLTNVEVVAGEASETLMNVKEAPDYVFIGGTRGKLEEILSKLYQKNPACRIVITAITLETLAAVTAYYANKSAYQLDISQITAARSKKVGHNHLMLGENPIYIMTASKVE